MRFVRRRLLIPTSERSSPLLPTCGVFPRGADFVREYQKVDGLWLPLRDETQVDVKVYGKRVLTIDHGPYQITDKSELAEEQLN
jgi:hypothetical protein